MPIESALPRCALRGSLDPTTGIFYRAPERARIRTAQACDKCRIRKAKCSGDHPMCERCRIRGLVCHYDPERRTRRWRAGGEEAVLDRSSLPRASSAEASSSHAPQPSDDPSFVTDRIPSPPCHSHYERPSADVPGSPGWTPSTSPSASPVTRTSSDADGLPPTPTNSYPNSPLTSLSPHLGPHPYALFASEMEWQMQMNMDMDTGFGSEHLAWRDVKDNGARAFGSDVGIYLDMDAIF